MKPVFVDVELGTYNPSPEAIAEAAEKGASAIMIAHTLGNPFDASAISAIAKKHGLLVIEDACQAHGATYHGRPTGSLGDIAAFSFYPGKNLGALGDGGAITTADAELADKVRILRNHGDKSKSEHVVVGHCCRLDNLQAAFLSIKLKHLPEWNKGRRAAAKRYDWLLSEAPRVTPMTELPGVEAVYHLYVVQVDDRDAVRAKLGDAGVDTGVHYPVPLHLQPAWEYLGCKRGQFPVSERLAEHILSLPMFPEISEAQVDFVAEQLAEAVQP